MGRIKKWLARAAWGAAVGALVAAKDAVDKGQITTSGLLTAVVGACLGAVARSIQDYEPWNGDDRRDQRVPELMVDKNEPKP